MEVSGRHLGNVAKVKFNSTSGGRIGVTPGSVGSRSVTAHVPDGAATGRPVVTDSYGNSDKSPNTLRIVPRSSIPDSGSFNLRTADATPQKAYFDAKRKAKITYMFSNSEPTDVRIDVVKRSDNSVVDSFVKRAQEPNTTQTARWDGLVTKTNRPAPNGLYRFRVGPVSGDMESSSDANFSYHRFKFPVRGKHSYGDGVGAPRAGHTHQGQDVLAACGTPLVAARGGRVQWRASQPGGAGNYIVIDGAKTGHDYAYMHLRRRSPLKKGQRVHTGQKIGVVGQTGDATGCHLHFEEWSAPGWYEGGHFLRSVTKHLKLWDKWS